GFLGTTDPSSMRPWITAFVERLRDLGWIEDRTIAIAYRWAEGHPERYAEIAAEFVHLNVNVIVNTGPAAPQAKKATSAIPIGLALSGDPVGAGLVASLAQPGGNITGLSMQWPDAAGKRLELLREVVPSFRGWRSWSMSAFPMPCWMRARLGRRLNRSASKSPRSKSGERGVSCPPFSPSRTPPVHSLSPPTPPPPPPPLPPT